MAVAKYLHTGKRCRARMFRCLAFAVLRRRAQLSLIAASAILRASNDVRWTSFSTNDAI